MRQLTSALIVTASLFLTACQTTSQQASYPLTLEDARSYGLAAVKVNIINEDDIKWGKYQKRMTLASEGKPIKIRTKGSSTPDEEEVSSTFTETDEFAANEADNSSSSYVKMSPDELRETMVIEPMREAFESAFSDTMQGDQKVIVEVDVKALQISPAHGTNTLIADFRLKDRASNSVIAEQKFTSIKYSPTRSGPVYSNSLAGLLIGIAVDQAIDAARSQIGKDERYTKMSHAYAARTRAWIAPQEPKVKKKKSKANDV